MERHKNGHRLCQRCVGPIACIAFCWWLFFFFFCFVHQNRHLSVAKPPRHRDPCTGRYVYPYSLPPEFNVDMVTHCRNLSIWTDMCKFIANDGLGPSLVEEDGARRSGWFATNQFALDIIFHRRMCEYQCLARDPAEAVLFYVPFYAGMDISRHLWGAEIPVRDAASFALARWLQTRPEWAATGGRNHFLVGGRTTWDFRRLTDNSDDWGNKLLYIPEIANMTMLVIESSPFHRNDVAIPYPTYFHPSQDSEITEWQHEITAVNLRPVLFSFAGAPRPGIRTSIRAQIIAQCANSTSCRLLRCSKGESKCHSPAAVMKLFRDSTFCLQPQGDSFTRRSIFDSMLSGCIPVFFHPDSAYSQYIWHLPKNHSSYSVFIPEDDIRKGNVSIEAILSRIPSEQVLALRKTVVNLIPGLVYADPRRRHHTSIKDAFDITIEALINRVTKVRVGIAEGGEEENIEAELGKGREGNAYIGQQWEEWNRRNGDKRHTSDILGSLGGSSSTDREKKVSSIASMEEIWKRDQAAKAALRKASDGLSSS